VRCRTLALALRERGAEVEFVCREHSGQLMGDLSLDSIPVTLLPAPETSAKGEDYAAWLGLPQETDAAQTIGALKGGRPDWIVADHYGLDVAWERLLKPHCGQIFVIDDLANRPHGCDVLLDQNYFANARSRYTALVPRDCRLLLGPEYALLRPEYAALRRGPSPRGAISRVLVFFGGSDLRNLTGMALEALSQPEFQQWRVDVVAPPTHPYRVQLDEMAARRGGTEVHGSLPHLAGLMAAADLAIGAGGTTTWERLCVGLPSLVISVAENQVTICDELARLGLIGYLGKAENVTASDVAAGLRLMAQRLPALEEQRLRGQQLVDGFGAKRVAEVLHPSGARALNVRAANENDLLIYFNWVNDPEVRQHSLDQEPVSLAGHTEWFRRRLGDSETQLYLLEAFGLPAGQIRFQRVGKDTRIAYSLDGRFRGRGWGAELVRLGMQRLLEQSQDAGRRFIAEVKTDNPASAAIFRKLGFDEEYVEESHLLVFTQTRR
jgi:UDP-2,4-diacetamido-2,4,6-trideoxy-beta-L-altropyranose hydrolase